MSEAQRLNKNHPLLKDRSPVLHIRCQNTLGENVLWREDCSAIYWIDIIQAKLFRYFVDTEHLDTFDLPYRIGSFGFTPDADQIIAAFEGGIAKYHLRSKELEWLAQPERHIRGNRFNDGRVDRQGRFWAGTMQEHISEDKLRENEHQPLGSLYCLQTQSTLAASSSPCVDANADSSLASSSPNYQCARVLQDIHISNGLCWNQAGNIMYHADSPTQCIYQYDVEPVSGKLLDKQLFAQTPKHAFPDGACVDKQDCVWIAHWGGSQVRRYLPNGEVSQSIDVPFSQVSCVAIGGPKGDWLLVTSAREGLSDAQLAEQPFAGDLLVYCLSQALGVQEPVVGLV